VSALTTNRTVKDEESELVAIRPPTRPPSPIPRFRVTRWSANAPCRRTCGARPARSDDWLGQKPAFPIPATIAARTACQGWRTSGKLPQPIACSVSAPPSVSRPPILSMTTPIVGPHTIPAAPEAATMRPEIPSEKPRTLWR
jgi:hypothetical protein